MNETELQGHPWDVGYCYNIHDGDDYIIVDTGDKVVNLTRSDLLDMLEALE